MKNVLIIGCSHSRGHCFYENEECRLANRVGVEYGHHGWYTYVDKFKDCDNVTVISTPGSGYMFWSSIFYSYWFDISFFKKFDTIIIQESHEFRFKVPCRNQLLHHLKHDLIRFKSITVAADNIDVYVIDTKNDALEIADFSPSYKDDFSYITDNGLKFMAQPQSASTAAFVGSMYIISYIASMMPRHKIYVWSMSNQYINPQVTTNKDLLRSFISKHITRLDLGVDVVFDYLWEKEGLALPYKEGSRGVWAQDKWVKVLPYIFDGPFMGRRTYRGIHAHANKTGNEIIGNLINKAL